MIAKRYTPHFSIYHKLVLTFLIIIMPLYWIGIKINEAGASQFKVEISKSMQSKVHFYLSSLELEFSKTIKQLQQYTADEDLEKLSLTSKIMTEVEKKDAIIRLQKRLILVRDANSYILNVSAYIPQINKVISANNLYETMNQDEWKAFQAITDLSSSPFFNWNDRIFINLAFPEQLVMEKRDPNYVLCIEISQNALLKMLQQFPIEGNGSVMIVSDQLDWYISNVNDPSIMDKFKELIRGKEMENSKSAGIHSLRKGEQNNMVSFEKSGTLGITLMMSVPEKEVLKPLSQFNNWFWMLSVVSVFIIVIASYWIYQLIHQPLSKLVRAFRNLEKGDFELSIQHKSKDEFSYLYRQFNSTVQKLKTLIEEVYEQKYRVHLAELRQLQSQINPHFLYNSFYNLYRMAKMQEMEKVAHLTQNLGKYFHFITKSADEVKLEEEIQNARAYVEIQCIRFEDHIYVEFPDPPQDTQGLYVPKLILQPLIENCYKHGLEDLQRKGLISIQMDVNEHLLHIHIEDNGDPVTDESLHMLKSVQTNSKLDNEGSGILNVYRRLKMKFGNEGDLVISRSGLGGLKVTITIPIRGNT
ncbi:two-component system, sensor histidine kinase YesM [Paenibacillus sp. yr247]|uniref:sensor histidine kinase n=1 Tax=Paenibacillus sp. yr247 TaxID=1761880 RepID=UPI000881879B|nr:histidine kinase [Paenibacillus sp. yr247]SDO24305.1 two-component system, sensor histidine kinase YesM [Paenibacillus sp. yr247]